MDRDREGFAILAQVEIRTARVHALITDTTNGLPARITCRIMSSCVSHSIPYHEVARLAHPHKAVMGMLLSSNLEAVGTGIKIWTIDTFEAIADNTRVAHVASREMTSL